jgi:hypothetical protein
MENELLDLQKRIQAYYLAEDDDPDIAYLPRVLFSVLPGDLYEILYYGEGHDDDPTLAIDEMEEGYNFGFCALLEFLKIEENARKIAILKFTGPDSGANGIRAWNFTRLLQSPVRFPMLQNFEVALTDLGEHNLSIIQGENDYEEQGTITKLVAKMPALHSLTLPSAPNKSFFKTEYLSLYYLKIQAGYNHQNFIEHVASASCFPSLTSLDYCEVFDYRGDMTEKDYTSFEGFRKLFQSPPLSAQSSRGFHFTLRNARLTEPQLFELQQSSSIQFRYVQSQAGRYVEPLIER